MDGPGCIVESKALFWTYSSTLSLGLPEEYGLFRPLDNPLDLEDLVYQDMSVLPIDAEIETAKTGP